MDNPIGLSTAALYPARLTEDALVDAARLGFGVVEVFLQAEQEYTSPFGAELNRRRLDLELQVHSLHIYSYYFDLWSAYPRQRQETHDRFNRVVEVAALLGACALTWHGLRYHIDDANMVAAFFESAAWARERAKASGITLCIENVSWCYLRRPEHVSRILAAGLPLRFTFDAFQAGETGVDPAALIGAMNGCPATVHLSDYARGQPRHLLPGDGEMDWHAILRALKSVRYRGPLILEPAQVDDPADLLDARNFVQQVVADVARDGG